MATATLLSQHSSNPLEVPSSDARNKAYRRELVRTTRRQKEELGYIPSSEGPFTGAGIPDLDQYHSHLAQLYPNAKLPFAEAKPKVSPEHSGSNNMYSEDELIVLPEDHSDVEDEEGEGGDDGDDADELEVLEPRDDDLEDGLEEEDAEGEIDDDVDDEQESHLDTDDELTLYLKPREEREEIEEEIADLEATVPQLAPDYKIVDRLGTGTFSSVYKAIDLEYHDRWDNTPWQGYHWSASHMVEYRTPGGKVFVAVKRIYVTSGPERIRNEISIMEDCRGCRHVSQLITAFRQHDQVVAIMPYHRNIDFRVSMHHQLRVIEMHGSTSDHDLSSC